MIPIDQLINQSINQSINQKFFEWPKSMSIPGIIRWNYLGENLLNCNTVFCHFAIKVKQTFSFGKIL